MSSTNMDLTITQGAAASTKVSKKGVQRGHFRGSRSVPEEAVSRCPKFLVSYLKKSHKNGSSSETSGSESESEAHDIGIPDAASRSNAVMSRGTHCYRRSYPRDYDYLNMDGDNGDSYCYFDDDEAYEISTMRRTAKLQAAKADSFYLYQYME